jgi:hypothetical protein
METARGNYEGFTKREVMHAQEARQVQAMLGNPSKKDFQGIVSSNLVSNLKSLVQTWPACVGN